MALVEYVEPAWLRTSVQGELAAGELIVAMADFSLPIPNQRVSRLFGLTNHHLRCMAIKQTLATAFGKNKPRPIVYSHAVAFTRSPQWAAPIRPASSGQRCTRWSSRVRPAPRHGGCSIGRATS